MLTLIIILIWKEIFTVNKETCHWSCLKMPFSCPQSASVYVIWCNSPQSPSNGDNSIKVPEMEEGTCYL